MKTISEYQQQALDFLKKHGIECEITFQREGLKFSDDKEPRNIFDVTFTRGNDVFSVEFGASIASGTCTEYDVLACLTKSDPGDFENFCSEFGYDEDSRKAYSIWESVVEEWNDVDAFFTSEELEELQEIN